MYLKNKKIVQHLNARKVELEKNIESNKLRRNDLEQLRAKIENTQNEEDLEKVLVGRKKEDLLSDIKDVEDEYKSLKGELDSVEEAIEAMEEIANSTQSFCEKEEVEERGGKVNNMLKRDLINNQEVRSFMNAMKDIAEKRATNLKVAVPTEILDVIVEKIEADEILKRVDLRQLKGVGRLFVVKGVNEASWTERGEKISGREASVVYLQLDAFKLAGLLELYNEDLADVDSRVLNGVINSLANSLILTLRKSIFYGTGDKSIVGVAKRLVAEAKGTVHRDSLGEFENVKTTNVLASALAGKGKDYNTLIQALGVAKIKVGLTGERTHFMNESTFLKIKTLLLEHAEGHSAVLMTENNVLPVIGGKVVLAPEIKDDEIISGYFSQYVLGMRDGVEVSKSEDFKFDEDRTVFKAISRFDGTLIDPKAFVYVKLGSAAPTGE